VDLRMKSIALTSFPLSLAFLVDLNRHFNKTNEHGTEYTVEEVLLSVVTYVHSSRYILALSTP
jgi:hypothetical protein